MIHCFNSHTRITAYAILCMCLVSTGTFLNAASSSTPQYVSFAYVNVPDITRLMASATGTYASQLAAEAFERLDAGGRALIRQLGPEFAIWQQFIRMHPTDVIQLDSYQARMALVQKPIPLITVDDVMATIYRP